MKVLVTGSSKGIGYKIAKDLIKEGHQLALHYNSNKSLLEVLINEYSSNSFTVKADLSLENEIKKLVDDTIENLSFPDCIINNAGIAESADVSIDFDNWSKMFDKTIDVNLKAPSLIFKEFLKYKREKKIKSRLRFINISSRAAFRGEQQDYISYACSKGGLISLTKTMSRSFGETDNIVAISIAPGFVRTEMAQSFIDKHGEDVVKKGITLDRLTEPKDISPLVSLIVSGKMDHSTGSTIDVNGGSFLR
ncbi:SDR family oxidoreductase [Flavobacteriaceae bacterium]|nr:SDR family oxidoreductase [Flavobacteriaceae bacterium]MDA9212037.1 SDR family oxidoreductase [Flavobacteriaceae bacterium]MDC0479513.1 SDR family oxidoreductase [Flavobacteriaceae bacterium]